MSSAPPASHSTQEDGHLMPGAERLCSHLVVAIVMVTFSTGISNLAVWFVPALQEIASRPGFMVVRVNTAVAISAAALSLLTWHVAGRRRIWSWMAQTLACVPMVIGGLTTFEWLTAIDLGIDQWLAPGTFPGDRASVAVVAPGRMSLNASSSLFLLGLALLALDWRPRMLRMQVSTLVATLGALPAFLGLVGYLLGQSGFTGILRSTNILFHAALCMLLLAVGVLLVRPLRQPVRGLCSAGADGVLLRWLLPGSAMVMLVLAGLIGQGRVRGLVESGEGTALMLAGGLVLLFALFAAAGRAVRQQEASARRAAKALAEKERMSQLIVDTALDGVVLISGPGQVADWNAAAERIFGWKREEMIGQPLSGHAVPEEAMAELGERLEKAEAVLGRRLELRTLRKDGSSFPAEFVLNRLEGTPEPMFVAFVRDITEQKGAQDALREAKERAERASQAKDDFLAALSHELRTPLTPVLLSAATLEADASLPDSVRRELAMIERNIALEARLIDDLLDLTRIAKGKLLLRREFCHLHELLGHAVEIIRDEAQTRRLALHLKLEARRSGIEGDPARLQQVFWNLLKNAVKFTSAGGGITVSTRDGDEEGEFILEVTDTGIGFTAEVAERLFAPFEQGEVIGDHQFGGLGLGLAIARAIVDMHGGKIEPRSEGPGTGATFTVRLPGAAVPVATPATGDAAATAAPEPSLRVLLVEDHEPTRRVLTELLRRSGNEVCTAGSVAEAIAAMDETDGFDVVVSDLGLPDGSGLELMPQLRSRSRDLAGIALSGYGMEEDLQRSVEAGFAVHLVKPIRYEQLTQALRRARLKNDGIH